MVQSPCQQGDTTYSPDLESLILSAYAASWAEFYQGAGAAPFVGTLESPIETEIGPYDEQPRWIELGPLAPLDEGSEFATLDDYFSCLAAAADLVEGGNDVTAVDAVFGQLEADLGVLDPSPVSYELGPSYLSAPAVTTNSLRSGLRYSAF